ncbi:hypothetical protein [Streptomyces sp. NPDC059994]|uniref:hypothetical protein n=1 Tax=Streptomyces sp. NPDC059994 TaxID=3347029 RepID=UPI0036B780C1
MARSVLHGFSRSGCGDLFGWPSATGAATTAPRPALSGAVAPVVAIAFLLDS